MGNGVSVSKGLTLELINKLENGKPTYFTNGCPTLAHNNFGSGLRKYELIGQWQYWADGELHLNNEQYVLYANMAD